MSTKRGAGDGESVRVPLSAIYRQLDDHLGPDEEPYDVGAGLERLVAWMNEETTESQTGLSVERLEAKRLVRDQEVIHLRAKVIERTASLRARSSLVATGTVAFLSLLAGLGLLFGLPLVPVHAAVPIAVTVAIVDALMAFAVGYIHRTTMKSLQGDLELFAGVKPMLRQESSHEGSEGSQEKEKGAMPTSRRGAANVQEEIASSKTRFRHRRIFDIHKISALVILAVLGVFGASGLIVWFWGQVPSPRTSNHSQAYNGPAIPTWVLIVSGITVVFVVMSLAVFTLRRLRKIREEERSEQDTPELRLLR